MIPKKALEFFWLLLHVEHLIKINFPKNCMELQVSSWVQGLASVKYFLDFFPKEY